MEISHDAFGHANIVYVLVAKVLLLVVQQFNNLFKRFSSQFCYVTIGVIVIELYLYCFLHSLLQVETAKGNGG